MATTARMLITRAYYLSAIVARELETPSGTQIIDGLYLLNALLDFQSADCRLIPYWKRADLPLIANQEIYFVENLLQVQTFTFNIYNDVRFPISQETRERYFGSARVNNLPNIPFMYHVERTVGGSNIYVYFPPAQNYLAQITGKYGLTDVTLDTDLEPVYDKFYIEYLRYALANYICDENDIDFGQHKMGRLKKMEKSLDLVSPPDLRVQKVALLGNRNSINWAQINIGGAWVP